MILSLLQKGDWNRMFLQKIVDYKRKQIEDGKKSRPLKELLDMYEGDGMTRRDPAAGIERSIREDARKRRAAGDDPGPAIIGEIKKASPSAGLIRDDFDPAAIAAEYSESGVCAVSVLTEEGFFLGHADHLKVVKSCCRLPVLRKDFIIDIWQIYESGYIGADAVLLITSILSDAELETFQKTAWSLGMDCLVEAHDLTDVKRAIQAGARIIGINNRNLATFAVDMDTTGKLLPLIPEGIITVGESGIRTAGDYSYMKHVGVDAVLIGETLMRSGSIKDGISELRSAHYDQS